MRHLIAFTIMGIALLIAVYTSDLSWFSRLGGLAVIGGFIFAFVKYGPGKEVGKEIKDDLEDKFDKK